MKKYILLGLLILLYSCSDNSVDTSASLITKDGVFNSLNYNGFSTYYDKYTPNDSLVNEISLKFDESKIKFLIFISPSCYSCGKMDTKVPYMLKVLFASKISESNYEIYDTPSINSDHPYTNMISLKELPSAYLMNDLMI
jgi:hypothetical protein